jgi:hypothetical protein
MSGAAGQIFSDMKPSATSRSKSRIGSFKSSFVLNEEALKLPSSVVRSYGLALAAVRSVSASDSHLESSDSCDCVGTASPNSELVEERRVSRIDPEGPMFKPHSVPSKATKHQNIEQFMTDLIAQREAITLEHERERFDRFWG